jgi:hypothetical protein
LLVQTFIFNWKNQYSNAKFLNINLDNSIVINSDELYNNEDWINLGNEAYFTTQFLKAIELFNGDIFFHIQADATYHSWNSILKDAIEDYSKYKWGIYVPNVDYTWFSASKVDISVLSNNRMNVKCGDCTVWMIHKEVIDYFKSLNLDISKNKYGWGVDLIFYAISHLLNKPVIRNYNHTVLHPSNRNYNRLMAEKQMIETIKILPSNIQEHILYIMNNKQLSN